MRFSSMVRWIAIGALLIVAAFFTGREWAKDISGHSGMRNMELADAVHGKVGLWPDQYIIGDTGVYGSSPILRYDTHDQSFYLQKDEHSLAIPLSKKDCSDELSKCIDRRINYIGILYKSLTGEVIVHAPTRITPVWISDQQNRKLKEDHLVDEFSICFSDKRSLFHIDAKID